MRYFPFKLFVICILLPPVLYLSSIKIIESSLKYSYFKRIEQITAGDIKTILEGHSRYKDTIGQDIDKFLNTRNVLEKSMKISIQVITKKGVKIYPSYMEDEKSGLIQMDTIRIAEENFKILNDGLDISVAVTIPTDSVISYSFISFFILISISLLSYFFKKGSDLSLMELQKKERTLADMKIKEENQLKELVALNGRQKELENLLNEAKIKLTEASKNEDGLIEEIVELEKKIELNVNLQQKQQEEIDQLKTSIESIDSQKKSRVKQKAKGQEIVRKRFKTLYKNLSFHDRAIENYEDLEDDMKLKCEEIIHLLNDDPEKVVIKRKVFGKKNRETVFEVNFSYNGRFYFRKLKDGSHEVLAVGTKNTQERELDFLDRL